MGIVMRLPFVLPKRRPSRLRRSGRDITAALISTNYLFFYLLFNNGILGGLVCTWWFWVILSGLDGWMDGWTGWILLRSLVQLEHLAVLTNELCNTIAFVNITYSTCADFS